MDATMREVRKVIKDRCKSVDVTTTGNLYASSRQQQQQQIHQQDQMGISSPGLIRGTKHRLMHSISIVVDPVDSSGAAVSFRDEKTTPNDDDDETFSRPEGDEKLGFKPGELEQTGCEEDFRGRGDFEAGRIRAFGDSQLQQLDSGSTQNKQTARGDKIKCHRGGEPAPELKMAETWALQRDESKGNEDSRDEPEDGDCCLSSELAKRVVLVDEADKMLLLRAQSATPPQQAEEEEKQQQQGMDNSTVTPESVTPTSGPHGRSTSGFRVSPAGKSFEFETIIVNRLQHSSRSSFRSSDRTKQGIACAVDVVSTAATETLRERRLNSLATVSYVDCGSGRSCRSTNKERRQSSYTSSDRAAHLRIATRSQNSCAPACARQLQNAPSKTFEQSDNTSLKEQPNENKTSATTRRFSEIDNNEHDDHGSQSNNNNKDQAAKDEVEEEEEEEDEQEEEEDDDDEQEEDEQEEVELEGEDEELEEQQQPGCAFGINKTSGPIKRASLVRSPLGHLVQPISSCQVVSGQESLDLELRGEREFNESLRKGSPIDTRLLGDKLQQLSCQNARATNTGGKHQRQRQSLDYTSILSPSLIGGGGESQKKVGFRRLTLDAGRVCFHDPNRKNQFNNRNQHQHLGQPSERSDSGKSSNLIETTACSALAASKLASKSKRGRRVSFGNIEDQDAPELETRKTRLASIAFGERAPQLIAKARNRAQSTTPRPTSINASLIASIDHQNQNQDHKTTNQQLENLLKLTRENLPASSYEQTSPKSIETSSHQNINQSISPTSKTITTTARPITPDSAFVTANLKRYSVSSVRDPALQVQTILRSQQQPQQHQQQLDRDQDFDSLARTNRSKSIATRAEFHHEFRAQPFMRATLSYKTMESSCGRSASSPNERDKMKAKESASCDQGPYGGRSQVTSVLSSPSRSNSITSKDSITSSNTLREGNPEDNQESKTNNNNQTSKTSSSSSPETTTQGTKKGSRVESIMANAKLRQEEFARLLEEHEQIVNEINRVETKMSTSQSSLQQQDAANNNNNNIVEPAEYKKE